MEIIYFHSILGSERVTQAQSVDFRTSLWELGIQNNAARGPIRRRSRQSQDLSFLKSVYCSLVRMELDKEVYTKMSMYREIAKNIFLSRHNLETN